MPIMEHRIDGFGPNETLHSTEQHVLPQNNCSAIRTLLDNPTEVSILHLRKNRLAKKIAGPLRTADGEMYADLEEHLGFCNVRTGIPGLAAEAMWAAHYFEEGVDEPSLHNTCYHFMVMEHVFG